MVTLITMIKKPSPKIESTILMLSAPSIFQRLLKQRGGTIKASNSNKIVFYTTEILQNFCSLLSQIFINVPQAFLFLKIPSLVFKLTISVREHRL